MNTNPRKYDRHASQLACLGDAPSSTDALSYFAQRYGGVGSPLTMVLPDGEMSVSWRSTLLKVGADYLVSISTLGLRTGAERGGSAA